MAISTYAELQAAVANWLNRTDLADRVPEFIALAEADINRTLRVGAMLKRSRADTDQQFNLLPTDLAELRAIQLNTDPVRVLQYGTPEALDEIRAANIGGPPLYYTIIGPEFELVPPPQASLRIEITYYANVAPLSLNSTNAILFYHPDIYLYGSLIHSAPFLGEDGRMAVWQAKYNDAIASLNAADQRAQWAGPSPVMRVF